MQALEQRLNAARTSAAVGPVLTRGLLRLHGKDRHAFVQRMSTQKVTGLAPGVAVHAAFLEVKAHVVADARLLVRPDDLLIDVEPSVAEPLRAHLARYVIMDQVKIEDVSGAWRVVPVFGPGGIQAAEGHPPEVQLWENPRRGAPAVDALVACERADGFWAAMVATGAVPLEEGDLEVLRVMAGVPRQGADLDSSRLVMEAGLRSAMSFDKGCYLGQEVVLRGTFRGQVQRGLVQLGLAPGTPAGALLSADGAEVGTVTSAVDTPDGRLGLGYVRRAHFNPGDRLATPSGEAVVRCVLVQERER